MIFKLGLGRRIEICLKNSKVTWPYTWRLIGDSSAFTCGPNDILKMPSHCFDHLWSLFLLHGQNIQLLNEDMASGSYDLQILCDLLINAVLPSGFGLVLGFCNLHKSKCYAIHFRKVMTHLTQ